MNFAKVTNTKFRIDNKLFHRVYQTQKLKSGLIRIYNVKTGAILFNNLNFLDVKCENKNCSLEYLQDIIYNRSCVCKDLEDEEYKIFDLSFDNTFE